jgi:DegV family protein with EDD domain
MPGPVAVVTDSTASLPAALVAENGLAVVPVQVVIGGVARDEDAVSPGEVAQALRAGQSVTTSRPSPKRFLEVYDKAASVGASAIVSVHLSAALSSTVESALLAARDAAVPVSVVDSGSIAMGLGFGAVTGAQVAAAGAGADAVAAAARGRSAAVSAFFYVDTLDYLRRGGRIGPAAAWVGAALSVKPLLHLVDGQVRTLEKVRTSSRALARLCDVAVDAAARAGGPVDLAVHHLADPARAAALVTELRERVPDVADLVVTEIGAVLGAHAGPGMVGVVVAPRP